ncbi:MAG: hypothetical protein H7Z19_06635 [Chitinophagaceae bacterium]|nr:hypothetical protein [Rubrivivax sp.]
MPQERPTAASKRLEARAFIGAAVVSLALLSWAAQYIQFHVGLNDFWGTVFYAKHMRWSDPASLHNGFFPIGYALLLKAFPYESIAPYALFATGIFSALAIAASTGLVAAGGTVVGALVAFAVALAYPPLLTYANIPGPDMGCVAFVSVAVWVLWRRSLRDGDMALTVQEAVVAGAMLGLAALWRNHGIVIAAAVIASYVAVMGLRPFRTRAALVLSFAALYSVQVAANLVSGHGPFETAVKANVYANLAVDPSFSYYAFPGKIDQSVLDMLLVDPRRSVEYYVTQLKELTTLLWPALLCLLLARRAEVRKFALFAIASIGLYALPAAVGGSPRAQLVLMPLFIAPAGLLVPAVLQQLKRPEGSGLLLRPMAFRALAVVALAMLCLPQAARWLKHDLQAIRGHRLANQEFLEVERLLRLHGMQSPDDVYTDSFDLYLPHFPHYNPRAPGGWYLYSLHGYSERYPEFPRTTATDFRRACDQLGVRFLVLTPASAGFSDFLFRAYEQKESGSLGERLVGSSGAHKIFVLR